MKRIAQYSTFLYRLALVAALATQLSGCPSLGLTKPESNEDKFQYSRSLASGAYKTIGDLKSQQRITANEGLQYFSRVESFEKQFPEVETLIKLNDSSATARVDLLYRSLLAIETELKARK